MQDVRPSPLAGRWYPGDPSALRDMMVHFLDQAAKGASPGLATNPRDTIVGVLAPHAGLRYSGPVAAHAFNRISGCGFDTVVVIGPLHHPLPGVIVTTGHDAYETPLGSVTVDQEILKVLKESLPLTALRDDSEHSIEIELPFLQHVLQPGFTLIPIMLRDQSLRLMEQLGKRLADALQGRSTLIVASSDLSHFYPEAIANELDATMLACVERLDAAAIIAHNERGTAFACGAGAIAATIYTIQQAAVNCANRAKIVNYATSGAVTGDKQQVVGYGAGVFWHTLN